MVGVCGSIAAYKSTDLIRTLMAEGFDVHVIPTLSALRFIGEATLSALSGNKVLTDVWQEAQDVHHISLAKSASAIAVYPASADFLARLVEGRASDLLTATMLSSTAAKILFPAMHTDMWLNDATQENVRILRERGYLVVIPEEGKLTSGDSGVGRLSDATSAAAIIRHVAQSDEPFDLEGVKILITAGATREDIDPVRFLSNKSSGKQGFALASAASARGAEVTLIAAHTELPLPSGVEFVSAHNGAQMQAAIAARQKDVDVIIMAAAISDYRPTKISSEKIKKSDHPELSLELEISPDILAEVIQSKPARQVVIGFAAETGDDAFKRGITKLLKKGCNIAVANDVSEGAVFGESFNEVVIETDQGTSKSSGRQTKLAIANVILDTLRMYRFERK